MLQRMSVVTCQIFFVSEIAQVVLHVCNCVAVLNNTYATFVCTACYDITANPSYHMLIANIKATKPITETPKSHIGRVSPYKVQTTGYITVCHHGISKTMCELLNHTVSNNPCVPKNFHVQTILKNALTFIWPVFDKPCSYFHLKPPLINSYF